MVITNEEKVEHVAKEIDDDGFTIVHSKGEKRRSCVLSTTDKENETVKLNEPMEEGKTIEIEKESIVQETIPEQACTSNLWAQIASLPPASVIEDKKSEPNQTKEDIVPEILVLGSVEDSKVKEEADPEGFKVVHSKKDRKRTRTLSQKTIETALQDTQTPDKETVKDEDEQIVVVVAEPIAIETRETEKVLVSEEICKLQSWANVASIPPVLDQGSVIENLEEPKKVKEIKIPDILVPTEEVDTKLEDEIDQEGFKTVHAKKDRKRTRTLSMKSIVDALKDAQSEEVKPEQEPDLTEKNFENPDIVGDKEEEIIVATSWAKVASHPPASETVAIEEEKLDQKQKITEIFGEEEKENTKQPFVPKTQ